MKNIIFVPDLAICISDRAIAHFFETEGIIPVYGRVVPYADGSRKGFGLVYFRDEEEALAAFSRIRYMAMLIYDPVTREFFQ